MRPVLGIPVLRPREVHYLRRLVGAVHEQVRLVVIDNSAGAIDWDWLPDDVWLTQPMGNLGVAASWNLVIRATPDEPYWLIANADTELGPGDLEHVMSECAKGGARWVGIGGDWRLFGITADCIDRVGWFDENFHPIYCEDADYERRCALAGVPWDNSHPAQGKHHGGHSWRGTESTYDNERTYPQQVAYFCAKWGVPNVRATGGFSTPFGRDVADWAPPSLSRLRSLGWHRHRGADS